MNKARLRNSTRSHEYDRRFTHAIIKKRHVMEYVTSWYIAVTKVSRD